MSRNSTLLLLVLALVSVLLVVFTEHKGDRVPFMEANSEDRADRQAAEVETAWRMLEPENAGSREREEDIARIEVRGELPDGSLVIGPTILVGGLDRAASIATPEEDGATYVYGQDDELVGLQIIYFDEDADRSLEANAQVPIQHGSVIILPLTEPYARLTGLVVRDGQPVPHAEIRFGEGRRLEVDEAGRFEFIDRFPIRGELLAGPAQVPHTRHPIEVAVGSTHDVVLELPGGQLEIQVVPEDGSPFRGAVMVSLTRVDAEQDEARMIPRAGMSSDRGIARFHGLPPAEYWVSIMRLTNSRSAPSVARVVYRGGFVTERVVMQAAAQLRIQVLPPPGMATNDEVQMVPIWEIKRDGAVVQEWPSRPWSVFVKSEKRSSTMIELAPGEVELRVGSFDIGFADVKTTLWPGLETELVVQLHTPKIPFIVRAPVDQENLIGFSARGTIQVSDESGGWVGRINLQHTHFSGRVSFRAGDANLNQGKEPADQEGFAFAVPAAGRYRFSLVQGSVVHSLGVHDITAATKELTL